MEYTNTSCLVIIDSLRYKTNEEKKIILDNPIIKNKLKKELLAELSIGDAYYNFRKAVDELSIAYILDNFDYYDIHNAFKILSTKDFPGYNEMSKDNKENIYKEIDNSKIRNNNEYKFFVTLSEIDINKVIKWVLQDEKLFIEFFSKSSNFYSMFYNVEYDLIVKCLYKLEKYQDKLFNDEYEFVTSIGTDNQKALLGENFNDETILNIIKYFNKDAISYFFASDKRAIRFLERINIYSYIDSGIKFSDNILSSEIFFEKLKSSSLISFRRNINTVETYNNPIIIEKRVKKYYNELISEYNSEKELFKTYLDFLKNPSLSLSGYKYNYILTPEIKFLFRNHLNYDENNNLYYENEDELIKELKAETNTRLSEIIIDALFHDNIYNVWINIKEMLRYNNMLDNQNKVLSEDKVKFYQTILNLDKISSKTKIKVYNEFINMNINLTFYDDLRKLKDLSYENIKKDLLDLSTRSQNISIDESKRVGSTVYDLRDSKYTMLVRSKFSHKDKASSKRNCYSIISNENNEVYGNAEDDRKIIYGYSSFASGRVVHMFESDAYSSDVYKNSEVSRYVNRIATTRELVNGSRWYSEVEIINESNNENEYINMKPDFIVVYDDIRDIDIRESHRLNIPIVIVKKTKLAQSDMIDMNFDRERDLYVNSIFDEERNKKFR